MPGLVCFINPTFRVKLLNRASALKLGIEYIKAVDLVLIFVRLREVPAKIYAIVYATVSATVFAITFRMEGPHVPEEKT
jgi:ABC-type enterochelin transport system permease subunit